MHMLVHKTHYMKLCSMNTKVPCSQSNNINHHRIPQMIPEELQIFTAVASFTQQYWFWLIFEFHQFIIH